MKIQNLNRFLSVLGVVFVFFPTVVLGATMQVAEEITIPKGVEITDNLYLAAGTISISGAVAGDVYAVGGNTLISENVRDDVVIAGGTITVLGNVGGDLRIVGGTILVAGIVGGELVAAGGTVTVSPAVTVGGDAVLAGGQVVLDGRVMGDAQIFSGTATVNGTVQGNLMVSVDESLMIGDGTVIEGNLLYRARSADTLTMGNNVVITGEVIFEKITSPETTQSSADISSIFGTYIIAKLVISIVTALVLMTVFSGFSKEVTHGATQNTLRLLSYGFISLVVLPVAVILLLITIIGAPLGLLLLLLYGSLLLVSSIYASVVTGVWISHMTGWFNSSRVTWKHVVGGAIALTLISLVPIVGWIVGFGIFLITLGSITDLLITLYKQNRVWQL